MADTQDTTQQAPGWFSGLLDTAAQPTQAASAPTPKATPGAPATPGGGSDWLGNLTGGLNKVIDPIASVSKLNTPTPTLRPPTKTFSDPFSDFLIEQGHATLERQKTIDAAIDDTTKKQDAAYARGDRVAADNYQNKVLRLKSLKEEWDPTPRPAPPEYKDLPPVPSGKPLPVFGPRPDATVDEAIQHTIADLGLMIQMAFGVSKGNPIGASAAFEGAMHGAAEGNRIRFEREWRRWNAEAAKIRYDNQNRAQEFNDKVTLRSMDEEDWKHRATLYALENDLGDEAVRLAQTDPARLQARLNQLVHISERLDTNLTHLNTTMGLHETHLRQEADSAERRRHNLVTEAQGANTGMSDDALDLIAGSVANGAPMPAMGMGKAASSQRAQVWSRVAQIRRARGDEPGALAADQAGYAADKAELTKLQTQRGPVLAFSRTADLNLDMAVELSDKVDRSGTPVYNRYLLKLAGQYAGDPDVAKFEAANRVGINETAKVTSGVSGGAVTSDSARKEIESMLNTAQTPEQYKEVVKTLKRDMQNRIKGYDEQIGAVQGRLGRKPPPAPSESREVLQKSDPRYQQLRQRGMSDADIESKYDVTVR